MNSSLTNAAAVFMLQFSEEFVVVVEAYKYSGADDVDYGIAWGRDNENFYYFQVALDGWYIVSW